MNLHHKICHPFRPVLRKYPCKINGAIKMNRRIGTTTLRHLLDDARVRRATADGRTLYSAVDVVAVLTDAPATAREEWETLKHEEPALRARCARVELPEAAGEVAANDLLPLAGVLRLVQALDAPKAERLRGWLADAAAQAVEEEDDPELGVQRARQAYEAQGRSRRWIDGRLRCVSARQDVVGEWYKRGVRDGEGFRLLTNALLVAAFGMDATDYRAHKGLTNTGVNLRDHMTDGELTLLSLAETVAAALHRRRNSDGEADLLQDVADAGAIAAQVRDTLEAGAPHAQHATAA
jgi:hypothetical protein